MPLTPNDSLDIATLSQAYARGTLTPADGLHEIRRRIEAHGDPAVWIDLLSEADIDAQLQSLDSARAAGKNLPLFGIPFAVKDNIDVAHRPTTAACAAFTYTPPKSATAVSRLQQAGAILVGKTNLDQFATGLVGVRSPFGIPKNPFNPDFITGGSSSGSAVAVAVGLVSFALGTDTAGSGRVPAAFNNIVGLKPTRGLLSCAGVVPACKSLDCLSIFTLTCTDAATVADIAQAYDRGDPYSRPPAEIPPPRLATHSIRFGIPRPDQLQFFGNTQYQRLYHQVIERFQSLGHKKVLIDFEPFNLAGNLLYQGPWVAERVAGLRQFLERHSNELMPVTAKIFASASKFTAVDTFAAAHRLAALHQASRRQWELMDVLLLPTTGTIYTQAEVAAEPIELNRNLGRYTQFANLLDLCAVAIPGGFTTNGLPFGVTLIAPPGQDRPLLALADQLHRQAPVKLGATGNSPSPGTPLTPSPGTPGEGRGEGIQPPSPVLLAVVGAHLSGQPLNWQLTSRNARLIRTCKTAACYQLFALANTTPAKPGLLRVEPGGPSSTAGGSPIEVEIWQLTPEAFGSFVAEVPSPMAIGTLQLEDGQTVKGFLCEPAALAGATDITHHGGWRSYLASTN